MVGRIASQFNVLVTPYVYTLPRGVQTATMMGSRRSFEEMQATTSTSWMTSFFYTTASIPTVGVSRGDKR